MELRLTATLSEHNGDPCFKDERGRLWDFTGDLDKQARSRVTVVQDFPTRYIIEGVLEELPSMTGLAGNIIVLTNWTDITRYLKEIG